MESIEIQSNSLLEKGKGSTQDSAILIDESLEINENVNQLVDDISRVQGNFFCEIYW